MLFASKEIYLKTDGAFDPTVMPLVNAYGFGFEEKNIPDSVKLDSLLKLVGFNKIEFNNDMEELGKALKGFTVKS